MAQSRVQVARQRVELVVVLLGTAMDAAATRQRLSQRELASAFDEALRGHPRVAITEGDDFAVRLVNGECPQLQPAGP